MARGPSVLLVLVGFFLLHLHQPWLGLASGQWADTAYGLLPTEASNAMGCFWKSCLLGSPSAENRGQWEEAHGRESSSWSQPPLWHTDEKQMYVLQVTEDWNLFLMTPELAEVHPLRSGAPHYPFRFLRNCDFTCQPKLQHPRSLDSLSGLFLSLAPNACSWWSVKFSFKISAESSNNSPIWRIRMPWFEMSFSFIWASARTLFLCFLPLSLLLEISSSALYWSLYYTADAIF